MLEAEFSCYVPGEQMDVQNIASHEIGHRLVLGDLYDECASELTMYGYGNYGEMMRTRWRLGYRSPVGENLISHMIFSWKGAG